MSVYQNPKNDIERLYWLISEAEASGSYTFNKNRIYLPEIKLGYFANQDYYRVIFNPRFLKSLYGGEWRQMAHKALDADMNQNMSAIDLLCEERNRIKNSFKNEKS
jgi:hypothetical protein